MQHIADAVGIKTITIFGPTNPRIFGAYSKKAEFIEVDCDCKYCYGTDKYLSCDDRKCLNEIKVKKVLDKIKKAIQND